MKLVNKLQVQCITDWNSRSGSGSGFGEIEFSEYLLKYIGMVQNQGFTHQVSAVGGGEWVQKLVAEILKRQFVRKINCKEKMTCLN